MRKKICFIVSSPITARAFLVKHFEMLSKEFDVSLIANFENEDMSFYEGLPLVNVKSIGIHRSIHIIKDLIALYDLKKYLKLMQFDAIHTVTPKAGLLGMVAGKWVGTENRIHIFTGQVWHTQKGFFKRLLMSIDKIIVKCSTVILVDGLSQRKYLIENSIVNDKNSFVLGRGSISGVDTNKFIPSKEIREKMRNELSLVATDVVFMFLGRFNKDKGLLDLALAFKKTRKENKDAKLLLVGFDEENLEAKIKEIVNDDAALIFIGPTSVPQDYLQTADVFCLPSYREGFGTSVIEASLMNLPILCSDTYGLMETIVENETGLRHEVANVTSIYNQMLILVNDKEKRMDYGAKGAEYVKQFFTAEAISKEWVSFYKKILS